MTSQQRERKNNVAQHIASSHFSVINTFKQTIGVNDSLGPRTFFYLWVHGVVVLLRPDPFPDQMVPHGVCRGLVEVELGGYVAVFDQGVVQVPVEASPDGGHVFQLGKMPHRDLLLAITWALRCSHLQLDELSK